MIMLNPEIFLQPADGLLIVDVQVDFCPGGALPIPNGDQVLDVVNLWIQTAYTKQSPLFFSRDFHPLKHPSFQDQGGSWPVHCLQDSPGAEFHPHLFLPQESILITKGVRFDHDQNSAFDQTGLQYLVQKMNLQRMIVAGLALDVCVQATVLDSLKVGLETHVLLQGTRAVSESGGQQAQQQMQQAGAVLHS